ncbi:MAG: hypothetical protein ACI4RP_07300 [Acutalibacteraceae bacterium]
MLEPMNALDRLSRATATSSGGRCRHLFLPETGTLLSVTLTFPLTGEFPPGEGLPPLRVFINSKSRLRRHLLFTLHSPLFTLLSAASPHKTKRLNPCGRLSLFLLLV